MAVATNPLMSTWAAHPLRCRLDQVALTTVMVSTMMTWRLLARPSSRCRIIHPGLLLSLRNTLYNLNTRKLTTRGTDSTTISLLLDASSPHKPLSLASPPITTAAVVAATSSPTPRARNRPSTSTTTLLRLRLGTMPLPQVHLSHLSCTVRVATELARTVWTPPPRPPPLE